MTNFKKKAFYNVITGEDNNGLNYGQDAKIFRNSDNIELMYDSHGSYLGIRVSMGKREGKREDGKFIWTMGPYYYKFQEDLKVWEGARCLDHNMIKIGNEAFVEINKGDVIK